MKNKPSQTILQNANKLLIKKWGLTDKGLIKKIKKENRSDNSDKIQAILDYLDKKALDNDITKGLQLHYENQKTTRKLS